MPESEPPLPATPLAPPVGSHGNAPARRAARGCLLPFALLALFLSLVGNLVLSAMWVNFASEGFDPDREDLQEKFYLGDGKGRDKVAVVKMEGVISESGIAHAVRQIEAAAKDPAVKAVVLRVDSPGGSVSASDELHRCLVDLRDDTGRRFKGSGPKPLVVSMGGVAASGGYYVAVAGSPIFAERTTITGSIGVFAALPNVAQLASNNGVKVELIKAGDIKASGSFFHDLSQEERQTWQDTVDAAYDTFLGVIEAGRPALTRARLRTETVIARDVPARDSKGNLEPAKDGAAKSVRYTRVRADGGTFTAEQAKQFGLVDDIADLPAAVRAAAAKANLSNYRAIVYAKPPTLLSVLAGAQAGRGAPALDPTGLGASLAPRLWYLVPSADGAILTAGR